MKTLVLILFCLVTTCLGTTLYAQDKQSNDNKAVVTVNTNLRSLKGVLKPEDSVKVSKVSQIKNMYKLNMKKLMLDSSLTVEQRQNRIDALLTSKNAQLQSLLDARELKALSPETETKSPVFGKRTDIAPKKQ